MTQAAEILDGWMVMPVDDVLSYHAAMRERPGRGLTVYHAGQSTSDDSGATFEVYGVERLGDGFQTVLTSIALHVPNKRTSAMLARIAAPLKLPLEVDEDGLVNVGVMADDFDPEDRSSGALVLGIVESVEDDMARFLATARSRGLLKGAALGVRNINASM